MIQNVEKTPKIALCRACHGTGVVQRTVECPPKILRRKKVKTVEEVCLQCGGSGRVIVSAKMELDIQPYNPKKE